MFIKAGIITIIVLFICAFGTTVGEARILASPTACPGQLNANTSSVRQKRAMFCLINHARRSIGIPLLKHNRLLGLSSQAKARDIFHCQQFSHFACGRSFAFWFKRSGYTNCQCAYSIGENLAWAGSNSRLNRKQSPRRIFIAWLRSKGHRQNILDSRWREQGLGLLKVPFAGYRNAVVWVNHFAYRRF